MLIPLVANPSFQVQCVTVCGKENEYVYSVVRYDVTMMDMEREGETQCRHISYSVKKHQGAIRLNVTNQRIDICLLNIVIAEEFGI